MKNRRMTTKAACLYLLYNHCESLVEGTCYLVFEKSREMCEIREREVGIMLPHLPNTMFRHSSNRGGNCMY